ncbi:Tripeptidyl-peptidase sed3 [Mycena indigotica]|uniref:tripeptidyl-peptidase II n=1 Tax=Mycena indigotica TaxID=2126181 RepID=A0A8H6T301_9AGAR|nr:Tripeptidyl-peptidase sed3 [Mycena indigotica]KAF7309949.1 Tripeptidyl-peptidase sed3 [Mycena indigotica]
MLTTTFFWTTTALIAAVSASPLSARQGYHQQYRRSAPEGFTWKSTAPSDYGLKLRIALASNDAPGLQRALLDVSTPGSENYGKHLTKDEVNGFLAPTPQALAAVTNWLGNNNVSSTSGVSGDWLTINVPVAKANALLSANFEMFEHTDSGNVYARTLNLALPDSVAPFIEHIFPTTEFNSPMEVRPVMSLPETKGLGRRQAGGKAQRGPVTPGEYLGFLDTFMLMNVIQKACKSSMAFQPRLRHRNRTTSLFPVRLICSTYDEHAYNYLPGFLGQFAQGADLQTFLTNFRKDTDPRPVVRVQTLDGGQNPQSAQQAGVEALDIQYTVGVATGVPVTFVSVGNQVQDGALGGFLDIINFFLGVKDADVPLVMSTSYGLNEEDLPPALETKLCNAYAALGARGSSILFASGDAGVNGGVKRRQCKKFLPAFPSTCPFVTSVGSTFGGSIEVETGSKFSSGGFSDVFAMPDYQTKAVNDYLALLGNKNAGLFNTKGRAFPDVAAQGENFQVVNGGRLGGVDGTSASCPVFASVIGLINDELIGAGKKPLGFLNPFLYSNAGAMNDITLGNNPGCDTDGFPALKGWDPVTGLGTPNFEKLRKAAGL